MLRGLIPYSYGSVVRDLNIRYVNASATITYSAKDADGVPTAFFGGVVGCILGGDNIIDGVVVNGTTAENLQRDLPSRAVATSRILFPLVATSVPLRVAA